MELKVSKKGNRFYGCSRWPLCENTRSYADVMEQEIGDYDTEYAEHLEDVLGVGDNW